MFSIIANVYLKIYGDLRKTERIILNDSKTHRNKFERNHMDRFTLEQEYLGELIKIK